MARKNLSGDLKELQDRLIAFYKDQKFHLPIAPLVEHHNAPVVDIYVLPRMMIADKPTFGMRIDDSEKIPIYKYKDLFEDRHEKKKIKKIFITAGGGMGKTAFARKMMLTWCHAWSPDKKCDKKFSEDDIKTMRTYDFFFLLELRDSRECDIEIMIRTIVKENIVGSFKKTIEEALNSCKCLVLLDGLDQWNHQQMHSGRCQGNLEMPYNRHTNKNVTIVTTVDYGKSSVLKEVMYKGMSNFQI